jgi:soluble lytic murein transglycosylase-like protein
MEGVIISLKMASESNNKCPLYWVWLPLILSGIILAGHTRAVRAEPYLRVCKKGVVYYYFSNRAGKSAKQAPHAFGRSRVIRPQARKQSITNLEPVIQAASRQHSLPPALIKAVIRVESNFNPAATSPKGAQGLMQLMPNTADELQVSDPYDVRENVCAGTRYLGILMEKFNYRLPLALAAYNAGPHRVEQCKDVPPIRETQDFVRDVCINFLELAGIEPAHP